VGWGSGSRLFSRWVLHLDPDPQPIPRQAHRRDGIPVPTNVLRQANTPHTTAVSAWRAPCLPVLTVTSGQPR
jgi:hypothetical protein